MPDYPEHDKLRAVQEQTQAIGEFLEWLDTQRVQLMVYREDLKDYRPTDPECTGSLDSDNIKPCDQTGDIGDGDEVKPRAWWRRHCFHWQGHLDILDEPEGAEGKDGHCCRCGKDREYEITTRGWVHEQRNVQDLLAAWAGIDRNKLEAEKRQMLDAIRTANEQPAAAS